MFTAIILAALLGGPQLTPKQKQVTQSLNRTLEREHTRLQQWVSSKRGSSAQNRMKREQIAKAEQRVRRLTTEHGAMQSLYSQYRLKGAVRQVISNSSLLLDDDTYKGATRNGKLIQTRLIHIIGPTGGLVDGVRWDSIKHGTHGAEMLGGGGHGLQSLDPSKEAGLYLVDGTYRYSTAAGSTRTVPQYRLLPQIEVSRAVKAWSMRQLLKRQEQAEVAKAAAASVEASKAAAAAAEAAKPPTPKDEQAAAKMLESIRSLKRQGKDKAAEFLVTSLMRRYSKTKAGKEWTRKGS